MAGGNIGELTHFEHLAKENLVNNRSANRLLMISTNLDGFSLANHRQFANVSPRQSFPPYGITVTVVANNETIIVAVKITSSLYILG